MHLDIIGEINNKTYRRLLNACRSFEDSDALVNQINITLNSEGGEHVSALAIAALMRKYRQSILFTVEVHGEAASAAVLILASGFKGSRRISKEAWVMVHESGNDLTGDVSTVERETRQMRRLEEQWCELMQELTGTAKDVWAKLHKETTYLSPEECLKLGLVDEIV